VPNYLKKVVKAKGGELPADEEFTAATFTNPAGAAARSAGFGVGGVVGGAIAARAGSKREDEHGEAHRSGLAERLPSGQLVLGLTNKRLLVYSFAQMKGGPKDLIDEFPLSDLAGADIEKLKLVYRLVLRFADGSVVDLDAGRAAGAPEFAEALNLQTGR